MYVLHNIYYAIKTIYTNIIYIINSATRKFYIYTKTTNNKLDYYVEFC